MRRIQAGGSGGDSEGAGPRGWRRAALAVAAAAFAVLWAGGVAGHWRGGARPEDVWLASVFLGLSGLIVLLGARTRRGAAVLAAIALLGFAVEVWGANTGLPFGAYEYTDALRPRLFGAPPAIGVAWMVLLAQSWSIVAQLGLPRPAAVLLAANHFGYWRWERGGAYYGIPATNFAGWLFTALLALGLFARLIEPSFWARAVGFAVVLFFALAALAYGLALAACVGFALCAAQLYVALRARGPLEKGRR